MDSLNITKAVGDLSSTLDKSNKRKRIWNISSDLFCSVCGTCLDIDEQRTILKKLHIDHKNYSDHEIHAFMVQTLYSENKLSHRLDVHLNNKYSYEVSRFGNYNEDQLMTAWQDHMPSGDICGLYWVAVTHGGLSETMVHRIFCDVHMLSHLNGGKARREKSECDRLLGVNSGLLAKLQQEKKSRKELAKELASSEKERRILDTKVQKMEKRVSADPQELVNANITIDRLINESRELMASFHQAENDLRESVERVQVLTREKKRLESDLRVQKEINKQLYQEIESLIRHHYCDHADCSQEGCCPNLCAKRVLIIGGLTKLKSFYRDVVENLGGSFEYHDGYLKSGEKELEGLIKKSDIILCPVDCNSHGACLCVKKICNRIDKPYHMLANSSISSISQALTAVGNLDPS